MGAPRARRLSKCVKQTNRDYEKAWRHDISLSESASAMMAVKIAAGEPASRVIPAMSTALRGKFLVEDRSFWCPVLRAFVDLRTLTDQVEAVSLVQLAAQRHRNSQI